VREILIYVPSVRSHSFFNLKNDISLFQEREKMSYNSIEFLSGLEELKENDFKTVINGLSKDELSNIVSDLRDLYYNDENDGSPLSDERFDYIESVLYNRSVQSVQSVQVGSKIRESNTKVELPIWMGSMNKVSPTTAPRSSKPSIITAKLDGVSCLIEISADGLHLYTRGDGVYGSDITHIQTFINDFPIDSLKALFKKRIVYIRGELIMKKSVFNDIYSTTFKTARNLVSGVLNSHSISPVLADIDFVPYELILRSGGVEYPPSTQLGALKRIFNVVVQSEEVESVDSQQLADILLQFKDGDYEIDGLIVQGDEPYVRNEDGNPNYAYAFKMSTISDMRETIVKSIEWNISKGGLMKPVVIIEPVTIDGVTISRCSGFNGKFVIDNEIEAGAIILIQRAGSVIPDIVRVISPSPNPLDAHDFLWDKNHVNIVAPSTDENKGKQCIKVITNFMSKIGVKGVGPAMVEKLYSRGLDSLMKMIRAGINDYIGEGIGLKTATMIRTNLTEALKSADIDVLFASSGVFGVGVGETILKNLFTNEPNIFVYYQTEPRQSVINRINAIRGFSDITSGKIINGMDVALDFYHTILPYIGGGDVRGEETPMLASADSGGDLNGLTVVMSGMRDVGLKTFITSNGGRVTTAVSGKTDILVVASKSDMSSGKCRKALEMGISVMTVEEFYDKYRN
jgi:DNA ligase (NAD+)